MYLKQFFLVAALLVTGAASQAAPLPEVQPSGMAVPANLLRLSIRFAEPPATAVLSRLALRRADGGLVEQPFLEQELWSPDGCVLTVLLHPGRVKSGLVAHQALGRALHPGETVTLTLDGAPLKQWRVEADDSRSPQPAAWRIHPVRAGQALPLRVSLDDAIDGRGVGYLAIADGEGRRVPGKAVLERGETTWRFTPNAGWRPGSYRLVVHPHLEDAAGNRVGRSFEVPLGQGAPAAGETVLPFEVR